MSKALAKRLNILHIDTGAMYRALAYRASEQEVPFNEGEALHNFLGTLQFEYKCEDGGCFAVVNGEDVTQQIRYPRVSHLASVFSALSSVREYLAVFQRKLPEGRPCVMEGRDIGSVIFPTAFCKFFVTASLHVRAVRRLKQLREKGGECLKLTLASVIEDIRTRDERDSTRECTPLQRACDAELIDTSDLTLEDVVELLSSKAKKKAEDRGLVL